MTVLNLKIQGYCVINNKLFGYTIIICYSPTENVDNPYDSQTYQLDITKS